MVEFLGIISGIVAIAGVVLNNYKLKSCFLLWLFSNAVSAGVHVYAELWSMAARDLVFFALAVHGLLQWNKK